MTDELIDPNSNHIRRDLQMVETALNNKWDIKDEWLEALPKVMMQIIAKGDQRSQMRATSILMKMHAMNTTNPPAGTMINVGVKVENNSDNGRGLARTLVKRLRADGVSGINT